MAYICTSRFAGRWLRRFKANASKLSRAIRLPSVVENVLCASAALTCTDAIYSWLDIDITFRGFGGASLVDKNATARLEMKSSKEPSDDATEVEVSYFFSTPGF